MRYIDADKIEYEEMLCSRGNGMYVDCEIAYKDVIDVIPTADVVEVVRCKDCKHKYVIQAKDRFYKVKNRYYTCDYMNCRYDENHYCSYGERAEE